MTKEKAQMPNSMKTIIAWTLGIGVLALILIILLILFGNLSGSLGFDRQTSSYTNETGYAINDTTYVLTNGISTPGFVSLSVGEVHNGTSLLLSGNYTVDSTAGTITGAAGRSFNYTDATVSYVVTFKADGEINTESVIGNYSESATNTSAQFPVVGTIIGIALLLVILIGVLIFAIRKLMGVAGGSGVGGSNNLSSNSSFG